MHRHTSIIFDVINTLQSKNYPTHERVCVIPPPYYMDSFERFHPKVSLNWDDGPFFLQFMNVIQGTKSVGRQRGRLLQIH